MKVFAPFVDMDYRTGLALGRYIPEHELEPVYTGVDDYSYWIQLFGRWYGDEDLMVVEQDIEIHKGVYEELKDCPEPWCCFWYKGPPVHEAKCASLVNCLGCTKFSAEIQLETRKWIQRPGNWDTVDQQVCRLMKMAGLDPHVHGQVRHHHMYEVTWLPSPSLKWQRYTWRDIDKNEYPTTRGRGQMHIPEDAEKVLLDASILDEV